MKRLAYRKVSYMSGYLLTPYRLLTVWCLCWIAPVVAQEMPLVKNYQPEVMQGANQNWSVTQAPSRYMYSANTAGVIQYDGARWNLFPLPNRQIVRAVAADKSGNVFCGGFGEFGYWRSEGLGVADYVSLSDSLRTGNMASEEIWNILVAEKKVYFQSFSELYVYDYGSVKQIPLPGNVMFMQRVGDMILLPVIGRGLFVKTKEDSFVFLEGTEALNSFIVSGIVALNDGKILIGTERDGLFVWQNGRLTNWKTPVHARLVKSRLNKMCMLTDGTIALGTVGDGLFIVDLNGRVLHHIYRESGLQNNTVLALYEDSDGNLWTGLDKGLDLLATNSPLRFSLDRSGSLGAVFTAAVFKGQLYLGTNQGLFYRPLQPPNEKDMSWQPVLGINGQVWELSIIRGRLLCGHNDGTFLIEQGIARKISEITGGWVTRSVPWDPDILIQGTYTGLVVFKCSGVSGIEFSHRIAGFNEPVEFLEFDECGSILAAHPYRGLHRLMLSADYSRVVSSQKLLNRESQPTDFNLSLHVMNDKLLLLAGDAFYRWNALSGSWTSHRSENGFVFSGKEKALFPGQKGHFFSVYSDRVVSVGPDKRITLNVRLVNDRPNILPLGAAHWLFCLEDGYAIWNDNKKIYSYNDFSPRIKQIKINNKGHERSIQPDAIQNASLALNPFETQISIYYSSLAFDQRPQYRWRMKGIQPQWSEWQENNIQDFNFLPPGSYVFEVQSDLSPDIVGYAFRIMPRWYQTWYFRFGLLFMGAGAAIAILYWYGLRLENRHRRLLLERERQLHQQRIQERNLKLQEDVFKKAKDLANSTMQLVRKNEVLLEIKQNLTGLQKESQSKTRIQHLMHMVDQELSSENDWAVFEENFNSVHEAFLRKMKQIFPELTPGDLRLAAYLKMNLSSKEIAPLLGISIRGVENKRYRLRKKMGLLTDENLVEFLIGL